MGKNEERPGKFSRLWLHLSQLPSLSSISHSSHLPPHLLTRVNSGWVFFYISLLIPPRLFFSFSGFLSNAARPVYPDFGPLGRFQACPFRPLYPEPPAAAFCPQGVCYNNNAIDARMDSLMPLGRDFRLFRSSPCLTLADRKAGAQVRC